MKTVTLNLDVHTKGGFSARIAEYYPNNKTIPFVGYIRDPLSKDPPITTAWTKSGRCTLENISQSLDFNL